MTDNNFDNFDTNDFDPDFDRPDMIPDDPHEYHEINFDQPDIMPDDLLDPHDPHLHDDDPHPHDHHPHDHHPRDHHDHDEEEQKRHRRGRRGFRPPCKEGDPEFHGHGGPGRHPQDIPCGPLPDEECNTLDTDGKLNMLLHDLSHMSRFGMDNRTGQNRILQILAENGDMTQRDLTVRLGIQPGSVSELLRKLERAGYIIRSANESDRRTTDVHLTDDGREFYEDNIQESPALFSSLNDEEKDQLLTLLEKLRADWRERLPKERPAPPVPYGPEGRGSHGGPGGSMGHGGHGSGGPGVRGHGGSMGHGGHGSGGPGVRGHGGSMGRGGHGSGGPGVRGHGGSMGRGDHGSGGPGGRGRGGSMGHGGSGGPGGPGSRHYF